MPKPPNASITLPQHVPIAASFRGGHPENLHYGSVAVVDAQGRLLWHVGDVSTPVFTRSALKPFQAMPLVARATDALRLTPSDIALLCASHDGTPRHVDGVGRLLSLMGADESALACGTHTPYFYATQGLLPPPGAAFGRLQHNCSGKHSGMLLLAHALGQPLQGYLAPTHPVQREIAASVAHFAGLSEAQLVRGIDGCSAPNYALPLHSLAHAFARLTLAEDSRYGTAPQRIARAMAQHPELVSGEGRNDWHLMRAGGGDWVSKVGADGVQAMASFSLGIGIAAKVSDGQLKPLMVAWVAALEQLGWLDNQRRTALQAMLPPPLKNAAGIEVGELRPLLHLQAG